MKNLLKNKKLFKYLLPSAALIPFTVFFPPLIFVTPWIVAGSLTAIAATFVVIQVIDKATIVQKIKEAEARETFKALIMEKSKNAVHIGIFDEMEENIEKQISIESEFGVSDDVKVGMIISCQ